MKLALYLGFWFMLLHTCLETINAKGYYYDKPKFDGGFVQSASNLNFGASAFQNFNTSPFASATNYGEINKRGDYVSQSEASALDQPEYSYKQIIPGDTRQFRRYVITCYPGGRCDNKSYNSGDIDQTHNNVILPLRAQITKQQQFSPSLPSINQMFIEHNQPEGRRLYPHRETTRHDVFN